MLYVAKNKKTPIITAYTSMAINILFKYLHRQIELFTIYFSLAICNTKAEQFTMIAHINLVGSTTKNISKAYSNQLNNNYT